MDRRSAAWTFLAGPFLALLPGQWRRRVFRDLAVEWGPATVTSGLVEFLVGFFVLFDWYMRVIHIAVDSQMDPLLAAAVDKGQDIPVEFAAVSSGFSGFVAFVFHPVTWILSFFVIEGLVRALAAGHAGQTPGTLPLALLDRAAARLKRLSHDLRIPLVRDHVTRAIGSRGWDLRVASCRTKPDWTPPRTVRFEGEFFTVVRGGKKRRPSKRPYVFLLRRPAEGEAFRGVIDYDPEDVLLHDAGGEGFLPVFVRSWRKQRLTPASPLVVDRVIHGDGADGWQLKVESCRPKSTWTNARTIEFEGHLYRFVANYDAPAPRSHGFVLVRLSEGEAVRGILPYSPDEPLRSAAG
ncbi:MAG: hypothetical protein HYX75_15230 [Acidobacteria bacterium]|nr:hypothetical protein [Acidobacteriota bacterium]